MDNIAIQLPIQTPAAKQESDRQLIRHLPPEYTFTERIAYSNALFDGNRRLLGISSYVRTLISSKLSFAKALVSARKYYIFKTLETNDHTRHIYRMIKNVCMVFAVWKLIFRPTSTANTVFTLAMKLLD